MKRAKSSAYEEDLEGDAGEKLSWEDFPRRGRDPYRSSSSHRRPSYSRLDGAWKTGRPSLYDREHDAERSLRRRYDHETEHFDRRKGYNRHGDWPMLPSSPRDSYGSERIHRSESFSGLRREFPKGFRSERDRPRGEAGGSWLSWRSRSSKDLSSEEMVRKSSSIYSDSAGRRSHGASPDVHRRKVSSRDSASGEPSRKPETRPAEAVKRSREIGSSSSEMEEGELEPDLEPEPRHVEPPSVDTKSATMLDSDYCENRDPVNDCVHEEVLEKKLVLPDAMRLDDDDNVASGDGEDEKLANSLLETGNATDDIKCDQSVVLKELKEDRGDGEGCAKDDNEDKEVEGELCSIDLEVCKEGSICLQLEGKELVHNHPKQTSEEEVHMITSPTHHIQKENLEDNKEESKYDEAKVDVIQEHKMACPISSLQVEELMEEAQCNADTLEIIENEGKVETKRAHETDNEQDKEAEVANGKKHDTDIQLEVIQKEQAFFDLETGANSSITLPDHHMGTAVGTNDELVTLMLIRDQTPEKHLDKGKSLAISDSTKAHLLESGDPQEGSGRRGFELVFPSKTNQEEKAHTSRKVACNFAVKEPKSEPLDLSLALPGGLSNHSMKQAKPKLENSSCAGSMESLPSTLRTNTDEFGTSISFTSYQTILHDPSCSLTQNSPYLEDNLVGSHTTFGGLNQVSSGTTWQAHTSKNTKKNKSGLPFHSVQMNGNSSHTSLHSVSGQHNFKPNSPFQQSTLPRQISPTNSHVSHDSRCQPTKEMSRVVGKRSSGTDQWNGEQPILNQLSVTEKIVYKIVSQPLQLNGRMLQEMSDQSVAYLKESICEMLTNKDKSSLLHLLQDVLRTRSDMTIETLSTCQRDLLEILLTIKTGYLDFIQKTNSLSSSSLVEIFLNLKCQNLSCGSLLPVDNCDCKMCTKKVGFCSACMCLVCSKFDDASNTCSWVGCDMCLHWCHTDCGLRDFHIRNVHTSIGEGFAEMQFHCIACGHTSEMFGFVREVFATCAKEWKAETLAKELQYVSRIFSPSNDVRGRRLHELADQMLLNLENNINQSEIVSQITTFLSESGSNIGNNPLLFTPKKSAKHEASQSNAISCSSQEQTQSIASGKAYAFENTVISIKDFDQFGRKAGDIGPAVSLEKKPTVDELERIIKFKQAEAKMYQQHADDARKEATSLGHIVIARSSKIDEDYARQIENLRLSELEERRREKLKELQAAEKAHQEYCNVKMHMEADIKNLLLKIEATRQNLNA
ncbi:protein OBERON 4-like [Zingiber officinale]|uniref:Protein OBERON 4 n=1 Tax=Zingiber officinale TaxID=94328 RepID=A0A8J5GSL1_ZINOF|nr:protein OBERON 4-like [Zingiber officinale]KAG6505352.1 hypothetical protein ZIOFF_037708 [Zingiber officinale]